MAISAIKDVGGDPILTFPAEQSATPLGTNSSRRNEAPSYETM